MQFLTDWLVLNYLYHLHFSHVINYDVCFNAYSIIIKQSSNHYPRTVISCELPELIIGHIDFVNDLSIKLDVKNTVLHSLTHNSLALIFFTFTKLRFV
jgi:hypothetical protein